MNRDRPDALIVGLNKDGTLAAPGVKAALATALFPAGHLSLARSARLAGMTMSHFAAHVSRLGIAVIQLDAQEAVSDLDTLEQWLASS
ncbi:UPF0175 family protein [Candidatus Accumulibacter aalborgensis]